MFVFSKNSLKKLEGVHPDLISVMREALRLSRIDFSIVQGVRTQQQQNDLYAQGRTKPGPIVTWTKNSKHLPVNGYGRAIDFAAYVNGSISWDEKYYPAIVEAVKKASAELDIPVICGADWKNKDWGHVELA